MEVRETVVGIEAFCEDPGRYLSSLSGGRRLRVEGGGQDGGVVLLSEPDYGALMDAVAVLRTMRSVTVDAEVYDELYEITYGDGERGFPNGGRAIAEGALE